jgi:hypothetical protein
VIGLRAGCVQGPLACACPSRPGVKLLALEVCWDGGAARLGRFLPVVFGESVSARYDPQRLKEVLMDMAVEGTSGFRM